MKKVIINIVRVASLLVACGVFTYASYSLMKSYLGYQNSNVAYDEINEMFMQTEVAVENETIEAETDASGQTIELGYAQQTEKWVWDYDAMREYNPESLGYIKLEDSRIQYPIVQHTDNDYYLERGFNRVKNSAGAIFVDARIQGGLDAKSCIIYGHDMLDGSMFADLIEFRDEEFRKNHRVFDVYIGYKHYRYYVFASFSVDARDEQVYKMGFKDNTEYATWINKCLSKSHFDYGVEKPTTDDKTIMLSTCIDDEFLRYVVVLVRGEEVVD